MKAIRPTTSEAIVVLDTEIGPIAMHSENGILTRIEIGDESAESRGKCSLLTDFSEQMRSYLAGDRTAFKLPPERWIPAPTRWQRAVRQAMLSIPWGEKVSYGDLADLAGGLGRQHARAAGQACGANLLPILVPCHRVLAHDGTLGGYGGGLDKKRFLLRLEGQDWREAA